jgi:hypothetical protein
MTKDEALRLALEALEDLGYHHHDCPQWPTFIEPAEHPKCTCGYDQAITAIKAALEAKDAPVGLIESLKDAQPCCGQYETCWQACTPRGKFIGHRDAQRTWVRLTKEDMPDGENPMFDHEYFIAGMVFAAKILEEKNK